jgi:hypothetical protein
MIITIDLVSNKRTANEVDAYRWGGMTSTQVNKDGHQDPNGEFLIWEGEDHLVESVQDRLSSGLIGSRIFVELEQAVALNFDSYRFPHVDTLLPV